MARFWTFSLGLTLLFSAPAFAQLSNGFHIDGLLQTTAGVAVTSGTVKFTIVGASSTSCIIYEENQTLSSGTNVDANGNFSLVVGTGSKTSNDNNNPFATIFQEQTAIPGKPSCAVAAAEGRLLRVTVGTDVLGTIALGSVPAAFVAQSLQGHPASDFLVATNGFYPTFNMAADQGIKLTASGAGSTLIKANSSTPSALTFTLPANSGANGMVLSTDGTGNLSWTAPSGGSGAVSDSNTGAYSFNSNSGGSGTGGFNFKSGGTSIAQIATNGTMSVAGDMTAASGTGTFANLQVTNNGTINGLNASSAAITGTLGVSGASTLGDITVAANHPITMASGSGSFTQNYSGVGNAFNVNATGGGSSNAAASLAISGGANANYGLKVSASGGTTSNTGIKVTASGTLPFAIQTTGGDVSFTGGSVGVGIASPTAPFEVIADSTSGAAYIHSPATNGPAMKVAGTANHEGSILVGPTGSAIQEIASIKLSMTCTGGTSIQGGFSCSATTATYVSDGTTYTPPYTSAYLTSCYANTGTYIGSGYYTSPSPHYYIAGVATTGTLPTSMQFYCMITSFAH